MARKAPIPVAVSNMEIVIKYLKDAARFYRSHAYKTGDQNRGRRISMLASLLDRQLTKYYDNIPKTEQVSR